MITQILLFDQPRAGGHLLQRILSKESSIKLLYNNFGPARGTQVEWLTKDNFAEGMSNEARSVFEKQLQDSIKNWKSDLSAAKDEDKVLMLQDHLFSAADPDIILNMIEAASTEPPATISRGNFSLIPDDLLLTPGTLPLLTIRDPRLTIPSTYRVLKDMGLPHGSGRPNFLISTTVLWQRIIYDFFVSNGIEPVVVDADDLMTRPQFARALAAKLCLDPNNVHLAWEPISNKDRSEMHPSLYASQKYLLESEGVNPSRAARSMDMAKETAKWDHEFGDDVALIREMVALAEPGYQWMYERRFKG